MSLRRQQFFLHQTHLGAVLELQAVALLLERCVLGFQHGLGGDQVCLDGRQIGFLLLHSGQLQRSGIELALEVGDVFGRRLKLRARGVAFGLHLLEFLGARAKFTVEVVVVDGGKDAEARRDGHQYYDGDCLCVLHGGRSVGGVLPHDKWESLKSVNRICPGCEQSYPARGAADCIF